MTLLIALLFLMIVTRLYMRRAVRKAAEQLAEWLKHNTIVVVKGDHPEAGNYIRHRYDAESGQWVTDEITADMPEDEINV